jgi:ABC-type maltose transport system permease subunit
MKKAALRTIETFFILLWLFPLFWFGPDVPPARERGGFLHLEVTARASHARQLRQSLARHRDRPLARNSVLVATITMALTLVVDAPIAYAWPRSSSAEAPRCSG